ncbi:hypothetical protein TSO5_20275 [Azospirillum sp. TSO5]|nr:hypothetical protein TSO5_20275 [Azospirillum sp. TSO5]
MAELEFFQPPVRVLNGADGGADGGTDAGAARLRVSQRKVSGGGVGDGPVEGDVTITTRTIWV